VFPDPLDGAEGRWPSAVPTTTPARRSGADEDPDAVHAEDQQRGEGDRHEQDDEPPVDDQEERPDHREQEDDARLHGRSPRGRGVEGGRTFVELPRRAGSGQMA